MNLRLQFDTCNIDWNLIPEILRDAGMSYHLPECHQKAFLNSHAVVFVLDNECLIGLGRAISDGILQAALNDVAVLSAYQGKGIGKTIVAELVKQCHGCNVILYASPGKEQFYSKMSFRKMKTAMALFTDAETKRERGFTE